MSDDRREFYTCFGNIIRANVMTKYGASTQICLTAAEVRSFFLSVRARDAKREMEKKP